MGRRWDEIIRISCLHKFFYIIIWRIVFNIRCLQCLFIIFFLNFNICILQIFLIHLYFFIFLFFYFFLLGEGDINILCPIADLSPFIDSSSSSSSLQPPLPQTPPQNNVVNNPSSLSKNENNGKNENDAFMGFFNQGASFFSSQV